MFEIFHPQSSRGLKASLALMHMITFIVRSSNLEWQKKNPLSVVEFIYSIGETFLTDTYTHTHTHTHTHIILAFLETE